MKYNRNNLIRRLLSGITNDELEKLVQIREEAKRPIPAPRIKKQRPVPIPRTKSTVKRMIDYFKQNPIPLAPQANLTEVRRAMKGYSRAFKINIVNDRDPPAQLQETRQEIGRFLKRLKVEMRGFKYSEALEVEFNTRIKGPKSHIYNKRYCDSKQHIVINTHSIQESLELSQQEVLQKFSKWMSQANGWVVHRIWRHYNNIAMCNPLKGSSYIYLPPELRNLKHGLINMKNNDNQCFRWCHIRRFNPPENHPERIKKSDRLMVDKLDYTGVEFPVSSKHYSRIEAQNKVNVNLFGYENKQFFLVYISTGGHEELNRLLISDEEKQHYVLIKSFKSIMAHHTKHKKSKEWCMHCLRDLPPKKY